MFLERTQPADKRRREGAVAGYDLSGSYAQISYWLPGEAKPETVSQVAGEEEYRIPALLAKRTDRDLWLYGNQAQEAAERGEAVPVRDLLQTAARGEEVEVAGQQYDPVALLSLFLKRTLGLLAPILPLDGLQALVFTVEDVSCPAIDALTAAAAMLQVAADRVYVIGRGESFFYYNISQPEELRIRDVLMCELETAHLKTLLFYVNENTKPVASFVEETEWEEVRPVVWTGEEDEDSRRCASLDQAFCRALEQILGERAVSTVYLIGEGFEGEWYQESLRLLCDGRRVFLGNNLYSKGACYAARQRLAPQETGKGYAFLGKDMLRSNVGMYVSRRGADAYLALFDAGVNWYDAKKECEFLLGDSSAFTLRITPLDGKEIREVQVALDGLPDRPAFTSRIRLKAEMEDAATVHISMEDLGFGEFFPATHKFWEESIRL